MTRKADQTGILRRGSACLSCRRRKLRCDGGRPVCSPCSSMKRTHECKYDDSGRKSRTQTLREKVTALEAKVRELESGPAPSSSPASAWSKTIADATYNSQDQSALIQQSDALWDPTMDMDPIYSTITAGYPSHYTGIDAQLDFSSGSSSSSDASMSRSLGIIIPATINGQPTISPLTLSTSSGTPVRDSVSERFLGEFSPKVTISREIYETLIQTFILHKKQCCFYSNTRRFYPSGSPTMYSAPPNAALMSAIYLLGSFFGQRVSHLEQHLLEQTLHDVSRSLHNQEQPMDMVQALSLLAQYFFFNNRDMEGNRQLSAAKRIAFDYGLHQLSPAAFSFELNYSFEGASHDWLEKSAVFWQMFMVNNFWSASIDCCVASPTLDAPCRHITTLLPVDEKLPVESVVGNSPLYALFDVDIDVKYKAKSLTTSAFKAMASSIFDRSLRIHNTTLTDSTTWAYRRSAEVALDRLNTLIQPVSWADSSSTDRPFVDTDLYAVHSLIVASTIHLHLDNIMDLKISWAARKVVELVNHLTDEDYQLLDPVLSVCWSSIVKVFRRMIDVANQKIQANGPGGVAPWTVTYLQSCVNALLSALQNMGSYIPLADSLLTNLDNIQGPLHPGLSKMLPPYPVSVDLDYALAPTFPM